MLNRGDLPAGSGRTHPYRSKGVLAPAVVGSSDGLLTAGCYSS